MQVYYVFKLHPGYAGTYEYSDLFRSGREALLGCLLPGQLARGIRRHGVRPWCTSVMTTRSRSPQLADIFARRFQPFDDDGHATVAPRREEGEVEVFEHEALA